MALKDAGLNIVWIDKATFPRDKVCGDAIPSNVQRVLKSIDGSLNEKFLQHFTEKVQVEGCRFIAPDKTSFDLSFVTKGHAAKRLHFDHFLFNMAKECNSHVSFIGDASVESIVNSATDVTVRLADGRTIEGQVIVGCDGANSIVRKNLAQPFINKKKILQLSVHTTVMLLTLNIKCSRFILSRAICPDISGFFPFRKINLMLALAWLIVLSQIVE